MKRRLSPTTRDAVAADANSAQDQAPATEELVSLASELVQSVLSHDVLSSLVAQAVQGMTARRFGNVAFASRDESNVNAFLHQKLGRDNLSRRAGPRGTKLTYIESCKAIELANQAFGFNGWSCNIVECKEEFVRTVL
jgi:hypothetical protein